MSFLRGVAAVLVALGSVWALTAVLASELGPAWATLVLIPVLCTAGVGAVVLVDRAAERRRTPPPLPVARVIDASSTHNGR